MRLHDDDDGRGRREKWIVVFQVLCKIFCVL